MIKHFAFKKILITSICAIIIFLISIFPSQENKNNITTNIKNVETLKVFVNNDNNFLSQITVDKNEEIDNINFIINLLTKDNISNSLIPNGFSPILPPNTELINYETKDNILLLNFSHKFLNKTYDYEKIIEGLVYTFCNNSIKGIKINVENEQLKYIPNTNTKLPDIINKSFGINKQYNIDSIKDTSTTTVYYIANNDNEKYYIPITTINNNNEEKVEIIIKELKKAPLYEPNLISYLTASYELENYEILEDSINIAFKNNLLYSINSMDIIEEIKYTLSQSIKDTYNINNVEITIN